MPVVELDIRNASSTCVPEARNRGGTDLMSVASPTKECPRCNTMLPAHALFCGTCGWQFVAAAPSVPPAGNYDFTQMGGQNAPGSFPPAAQPGYGAYGAPPQPANPGVYAPSVAALPKRGGA